MKSLGIVRKIDELGRVVIPKEIRKLKGWEDGTSMEMFFENDSLIIKEYRIDDERKELLNSIDGTIQQTDNKAVIDLLEKAREYIHKKM